MISKKYHHEARIIELTIVEVHRGTRGNLCFFKSRTHRGTSNDFFQLRKICEKKNPWKYHPGVEVGCVGTAWKVCWTMWTQSQWLRGHALTESRSRDTNISFTWQKAITRQQWREANLFHITFQSGSIINSVSVLTVDWNTFWCQVERIPKSILLQKTYVAFLDLGWFDDMVTSLFRLYFIVWRLISEISPVLLPLEVLCFRRSQAAKQQDTRLHFRQNELEKSVFDCRQSHNPLAVGTWPPQHTKSIREVPCMEHQPHRLSWKVQGSVFALKQCTPSLLHQRAFIDRSVARNAGVPNSNPDQHKSSEALDLRPSPFQPIRGRSVPNASSDLPERERSRYSYLFI